MDVAPNGQAFYSARPDAAHARHRRHRDVAGARAARHDQPRLRRSRALRRGEDARRGRRPLDEGRAGRRHQRGHAAGLPDGADGLRTPAAQPDRARRRDGPRNGRQFLRRLARRPQRRRLPGGTVEPRHRPVADPGRDADHAPVPLDRAAAARRRVLSSGGGICGTCDQVGYLAKNAEIFSPPYLFQADGTLAPRPAIDAAPSVHELRRGDEDRDRKPASIRKVALVRLGAVTHSDNMEQRYIPLSFTAGATSSSPPPRTTPTSRRRASTCSSSSTRTAYLPLPTWSGSRATRRRRRPHAAGGRRDVHPARHREPRGDGVRRRRLGDEGRVLQRGDEARRGYDAPYSFTWSGVAAGTYTLTARATDDLGATTTSVASRITVSGNTPPTTTLTLAADADAPVKESAPGANFASAEPSDGRRLRNPVGSYSASPSDGGGRLSTTSSSASTPRARRSDGPAAYSAGSG